MIAPEVLFLKKLALAIIETACDDVVHPAEVKDSFDINEKKAEEDIPYVEFPPVRNHLPKFKWEISFDTPPVKDFQEGKTRCFPFLIETGLTDVQIPEPAEWNFDHAGNLVKAGDHFNAEYDEAGQLKKVRVGTNIFYRCYGNFVKHTVMNRNFGIETRFYRGELIADLWKIQDGSRLLLRVCAGEYEDTFPIWENALFWAE